MVKGLPSDWGTCFRTITPHSGPLGLALWKDVIAVGLQSGEIITFDGTTGSQIAILSGHAHFVKALAFSSDGTSLVSGSYDATVKLWDVQTGGVIKTFCGHTNIVWTVSISADCTTIASGSQDKSIRLWDIKTGGCHHIMKLLDDVDCVSFSPLHLQFLISVSGEKVQQWDIDGHQIDSPHDGSCIAFSSDGTLAVLCQRAEITVWNSISGDVVAQFHLLNSTARCCCLSSDGRLVAVATEDNTVSVWDITSPDTHLFETLVGHTNDISSLVFSSPSSLITSSYDKTVKFWRIDVISTDPAVGCPMPIPLASAPIKSITLQAKDGIYVSSDLDGVVKTWDISTGICRTSHQTPAKNTHKSDTRLVNGRLILVWHADGKIHTWDVEEEKLLHEIDAPWSGIDDIRISGDGSRVFCLYSHSIRAWSTWTGEVMGKIKADTNYFHTSLIVSASKVWVYCPTSPAYERGPWGWDIGITGLSRVQLPTTPALHLGDTKLWDIGLSSIKDTITGKVVLQLGGRFARPFDVQLDGRYFLAHCWSGEVLILDFNDVHLW